MRRWEEIKAEKEAYDRAQGRDVEADRAKARELTKDYIDRFRRVNLCEVIEESIRQGMRDAGAGRVQRRDDFLDGDDHE